MRNEPTIVIKPRAIMVFLVSVTIVLLIGHVCALILTYGYGNDHFHGLVPLFNFALEKNVPTYFSAMLLLLNAVLFFVVWKSHGSEDGHRFVWPLLALVFCFLSLDEFATIHELLIDPMRRLAGTSGLFYFGWIIPYGVGVIVLAYFVVPVIWRLGRRFITLFALAAFLYVGGAIGIEMVEGVYIEQVGSPDMAYRILSSFQELLEITGLLILVHALLALAHGKSDRLTVVFEANSSPTRPLE